MTISPVSLDTKRLEDWLATTRALDLNAFQTSNTWGFAKMQVSRSCLFYVSLL